MKRRLEDPEGKQSHKPPPTELEVEKLKIKYALDNLFFIWRGTREEMDYLEELRDRMQKLEMQLVQERINKAHLLMGLVSSIS